MKRRRFNRKLLTAINKSAGIKIRAGTGDHKFIRIWAVVVDDRVFVRSWSIKRRSWYRTFLKEPQGAILVDDQEISIRALHPKSEKLKDRIDTAYLEKYPTPGLNKYARDLGRKKSRNTTTELIPD
jgi:hypothetical protein